MEDEFSLISEEIVRSLGEILGSVWLRFIRRLKAKGCKSAPKTTHTWRSRSNEGPFSPIFAHARSETEEDFNNCTGRKMITGPVYIHKICKHMQWKLKSKVNHLPPLLFLPCLGLAPPWPWCCCTSGPPDPPLGGFTCSRCEF